MLKKMQKYIPRVLPNFEIFQDAFLGPIVYLFFSKLLVKVKISEYQDNPFQQTTNLFSCISCTGGDSRFWLDL